MEIVSIGAFADVCDLDGGTSIEKIRTKHAKMIGARENMGFSPFQRAIGCRSVSAEVIDLGLKCPNRSTPASF
jgi:hypothetical protein